MVSEDVPANVVGDRISQWAAMIQPEAFTTRIANLIGVRPQADPGQPQMLALANHPSVDMLAAAEMEEPVASAAQRDFAFASELPPVGSASVNMDRADASLADAGLVPTAGGIRFVSNEVVQAMPIADSKPAVPRMKQSTAPASLARGGDYNVQLGSYFSMSDANEAWKQFRKRYPELGDAERVITKARVNGKIYYRVAAAGFAKASAQSMCSSVKGKGGGCIAYASSRPLPGAIDVVGGDVRVAAR
tara:strand:- start:2 stop:742 length:741 start_codon:yes stop_codon:yes gene_type:complete